MENKNLLSEDEFTRHLMKKAGVIEPSTDFTSRVMQSIHSSVKNEVFVYKPIISNKGWFWIGLSITMVSLLLSYFSDSSIVHPSKLAPYFSMFDSLYNKVSFIGTQNSFDFFTSQGLIGAIAAGWLLFAFERILRKQYTV